MGFRKDMAPNRRVVLRGVAGTIVGLPFLPSLLPRNAQAATKKKRLLIWFQPDGVMEARKYGSEPWWPSGTTTSFTLPEHTKPLESVKNDLVFINGIDNLSSNRKAFDSVHGTLLRHMLTGGGNVSIDQVIADKLSTGTRFKSLELGVVPERNGRTDTRMSYRGDNPLTPEGDPKAVYKRLFSVDPPKGTGGGTSSPTPTPTPGNNDVEDALMRLHRKRKSVLDAVVTELADIKGRLGAEDRDRLEQHTSAIRDVETALVDLDRANGTKPTTPTAPPSSPSPSGPFSCSAPPLNMRGLDGNANWTETQPNMDKIAAIHHDLIMLAFRCDYTRVASLMFMKGRDDTQTYEFLNTKDKHGQHVYAHAWANSTKSPNGKSDYSQVFLWRAQLFKSLIELAKATPDDNGESMFDNTLLAWVSEMGDGEHNIVNLPWVFSGRAGGSLQTGRLLRYNREPHTNAMISMAKLLDVSLTSFGLDGKSALAGL